MLAQLESFSQGPLGWLVALSMILVYVAKELYNLFRSNKREDQEAKRKDDDSVSANFSKLFEAYNTRLKDSEESLSLVYKRLDDLTEKHRTDVSKLSDKYNQDIERCEKQSRHARHRISCLEEALRNAKIPFNEDLDSEGVSI